MIVVLNVMVREGMTGSTWEMIRKFCADNEPAMLVTDEVDEGEVNRIIAKRGYNIKNKENKVIKTISGKIELVNIEEELFGNDYKLYLDLNSYNTTECRELKELLHELGVKYGIEVTLIKQVNTIYR